MSLVNDYFLWYEDWNSHALLKNAKRQTMIGAYEHATSKQMAEFLLNALDFDARASAPIRHMTRQANGKKAQADYVGDSQIEKIHKICGEQVRADWDAPQIDQEQFKKTLLLDAMQDKLKTIPDALNIQLTI